MNTEMKTGQSLILSFKKHKLALATSLLLGTMGATMLSSAPLFADVNAAQANTKTAVAGTLPELTKMIKANRSAVVSIDVKMAKTKDLTGELSNDQYSEKLQNLPKELREMFKNMPQMPRGHGFGARKLNSHGSGFIISDDGYVVTNGHVIDSGSNITVELEDKREFTAKVIGVDKLSDIALLKIEAKNLPYVAMGDSDKLDVGQWVVAIGTPFGLDYTATQGIVSALSRSLPADTYVPFIQTDAAINPGNSGGPLFNLDGQVIGVNSQIFSQTGGYMGVSFAIPVNIVKNVTEQLKATGHVNRGWLGVGIQGIDDDLAKSLSLSNSNGSLVSSVSENSPAAKAGLQVGDVILEFDNKVVKAVSDLPILVGNTPIGKSVLVVIIRQGAEKTLNVTVDKLKSDDEEPVVASLEKGSLGVAVSALTDEEKETLSDKKQGVKVEQVLADSAAENAGLKSGDIILSVAGKSIESPANLKAVIKAADINKPLAILLKRGDQSLFVAVNLNS